ncbi:DNA polymerase III subunit delta' [Marinobacterium arenosum]|uniref:DNA polymerase III subunit delta' n=1 Tax=Marinobacterium arenosum TaxID=2862496 RepID=UPI001C937CB4|nr:DNA polymerase III subunit delta' [Marinobacterium arenosum]MBY4677183.1 DNA polymerase III subunit delta' [Marinobacterium arenosum]
MNERAQPVELYPWLEERWRYLLNLHGQRRLPHALMINGAEGIGKGGFATLLARYLLCQQPVNEQSCGQCRSCQLNAVQGHPDLYRLEPDEPGKPIKVDQIRELTDFIYSTAQQGGYRIVIINPAHEMNVAAANALLKTLEEPGRDTVLMLLTHRLGQVMPTIKSRCQRVDMPLPAHALAASWVQQQLSVDTEQAARYLAMANGAPLAALGFADEETRQLRQELIKGLTDLLKQRRSVIEVAGQWHKLDLERLLSWLQSLVADLARAVLVGDGALLRQQDAGNMLKALAKRVPADKLFRYAEQLAEARKSLMLRQNPNKQLLMETLLAGWIELVR